MNFLKKFEQKMNRFAIGGIINYVCAMLAMGHGTVPCGAWFPELPDFKPHCHHAWAGLEDFDLFCISACIYRRKPHGLHPV